MLRLALPAVVLMLLAIQAQAFTNPVQQSMANVLFDNETPPSDDKEGDTPEPAEGDSEPECD